MSDIAIVTCSLNGVLTDPARFPVPVTPAQLGQNALDAWNAGATVVHVHFRDQRPGLGHLPSWDPDVAEACCDAIRAACPQMVINCSTGLPGPDISGPLACLERVRPEMAAMNAGSLNYLRARSNGRWAWPPLLFDNPVSKIERYLTAMYELDIVPECECFDTGIVRSLAMFQKVGLLRGDVHASLVMGVASGMPANPDWLPLLVEELPEGARFQTIAIGRAEVWALHRRCLELGGHVRTGLEDTFYLPDGNRAPGNGALIESLVALVREVGREPATAAQTRTLLGLA